MFKTLSLLLLACFTLEVDNCDPIILDRGDSDLRPYISSSSPTVDSILIRCLPFGELYNYGCEITNCMKMRGGGGQRKLIKERAERRKQSEASLTSKPKSVSIPPRYKTPKIASVDKPTFEEQAQMQGQNMPAWKLAELRLRSKLNAPWDRTRTEAEQCGDSQQDDAPPKPDLWAEASGAAPGTLGADSAGAPRPGDDESSLRQVNDGNGHLRFKGADDIPEELTAINDRLAWVQENYRPSNRWITPEDLAEEQRATAAERADELLSSAAGSFLSAQVAAGALCTAAAARPTRNRARRVRTAMARSIGPG